MCHKRRDLFSLLFSEAHNDNREETTHKEPQQQSSDHEQFLVQYLFSVVSRILSPVAHDRELITSIVYTIYRSDIFQQLYKEKSLEIKTYIKYATMHIYRNHLRNAKRDVN